ncbi:hypothetical protein BU23DRAFT_661966, partial [Bimuria novae-zelandiae CBS 107.79]
MIYEPTVFTTGNSQTPPLYATDVEYASAVPDYPKTKPGGFAYVIKIPPNEDNSPLQKDRVLKWMTEFQYSKAITYKDRSTVSDFLGGMAFRTKLNCTGILHCEHLSNAFRECYHTEVDEDIYTKIQQLRVREPDEPRGIKEARGLYFGVLKRFRLGACIDRRDDCRPELMQYQKD